MSSPVIDRAGWLTWIVLAASIGVTLFTQVGTSWRTQWFLFVPEQIVQGEFWRIVTPVFIHFSVLGSPLVHLLFNGLLWLVFASAIESIGGRPRLLGLFLLAAIGSDFAAYIAYGPKFGGLSGVVYALIGYLSLRRRHKAAYRPVLTPQMTYTFIAWLLLCYSGLFGAVANAAHLAGLAIGFAYALFDTMLDGRHRG